MKLRGYEGILEAQVNVSGIEWSWGQLEQIFVNLNRWSQGDLPSKAVDYAAGANLWALCSGHWERERCQCMRLAH